MRKPPGWNVEQSEKKDALLVSLLDEGVYSVTKDGRVISHRSGRELSQWVTRSGFKMVSLRLGGRSLVHASVHRLMALAFLPPPARYMVVDHINGDKADNRIENLAWCTQQENVRRDFDAGRNNIGASGEKHNNAKLSDREAEAVCRLFSTGRIGVRDLALAFGVSGNAIWSILKGKARNPG